MKYEKIKNYKDGEFRRLSGVKRSTFKKMIAILEEAEKSKRRGAKCAIDRRSAINGFGILKNRPLA
ncbi:IS5/IS1182 family transposase domain protein [Rickettsiales endosymbiont of Paramecium tredecaurelia]|nr:IS5/IS1182 family transposase domain protein [Candidatus Sarmatiella mevalonica]